MFESTIDNSKAPLLPPKTVGRMLDRERASPLAAYNVIKLLTRGLLLSQVTGGMFE
ncbi:hypothetical protein J6590_052103 [Homalodisca vitripennis]|nr:hypothetical protein J6590_052103 [Homalodisca vitripennis]